MKQLSLSAIGRKARDTVKLCGNSSPSTSSHEAAEAGIDSASWCPSWRSDYLAKVKLADTKLAKVLGKEVKEDDKVLFDQFFSRGRRNALSNIFCGLPSKGLRRLFAVYGIDEVQTKAPPGSEESNGQQQKLHEPRRRHRRQADSDSCSRRAASSGRHSMHTRRLPAFASVEAGSRFSNWW